MRLGNYASLDPAHNADHKGLVNTSRLCRKAFKHWADKPQALAECAKVLIRDADAHTMPLFDPSPVRIPQAFNKYELLDPIGEGGCGAVFSCLGVEDGKQYAMKIIRTARHHNAEILHRFRREIRALKAARHLNVIRIYDDNLGEEEDFPAFVMDMASESLSQLVCRQSGTSRTRPALSRQTSTPIYRAVLDATEALHADEPRLIHRDINPNNVLRLPNGTWVLADFGLAKFLSTAPVSTMFTTASDQAWGTEGYTAPEQYRDFGSADERSDVYSLGILLWELFTSAWPPRRVDRPGLPSGIGEVHARATEWEPEDRYQTVRELRQAFDGVVGK
jgi:serine/threonine protein kinase